MIALLVPLLGRPWNVKKMIMEYQEAVKDNPGYSELLFAIGKDDKYRDKLLEEIKGYRYIEGNWNGVAKKLNDMYLHFKDDKFKVYHGSADDITYSKGFDKQILEEINYLESRTGHRCWVLYGNDMVHNQKLCTHWFTTKELAEARGEFTPVDYMYHQYSDTVNYALGIELGILHYMPWILTHHHSWANNEAPKDENFNLAYSEEKSKHDREEFERWIKEQYPIQSKKIIDSIIGQINAKFKK